MNPISFLTSLFFVTLLGFSLLSSDHEPGAPGAAAASLTIKPGDGIDRLIAEVGLPDSIDFGLDTMTWRFGDDDGLQVTLHDGVVIGIVGQSPSGRKIIRPDTRSPQLGQSAAVAASILGNPISSTEGQFGRQFSYPGPWQITYRFGYVVGCRRD